MTTSADVILRNAAVFPLTDDTADRNPDPPAEAIAVRDGHIVAVGSSYDIGFLEGVETTVFDLEGRPLLPGFVDAHTHLHFLGLRQREADLGTANSRAECLDQLHQRRDETTEGWILGFAYDESRWDTDERAYLTRDDLDGISTDRPVAAFREDMHLASINSVAIDNYVEEFPAETIRRQGGEPTGVVVEEAVSVLMDTVQPDQNGRRDNLLAAQEFAHRHGVTAVHDMVEPETARAYRDLDRSGELSLRVRLNYYDDHLEDVLGAGLASNHGSDRVRMGAIKSFMDGSIGGRTARLSEPYRDRETDGLSDGSESDERGEWVTTPAEFADLAERVDEAGLQISVHAIGDEAIAAALDVLEEADGDRHRIEHAEILTDSLIERLAASDVIVSGQPNFLKWAREGGLYDTRLGQQRRRSSNRFGALKNAGATLAFGSDCMPLGPLFGIEQVVRTPESAQRLSTTEALRAYTHGGATAGFEEDRMGTIAVGNGADLVVLSESPWDADSLADVEVDMTVVGGGVVYDGRE